MKSWQSDSPADNCPVRIVRDTRVSAFTYAEAIRYLREHNHLYRDLTWEAWTAICQFPDQELLQAVDDYFMPMAYAETMQN
jgi:hypothetical protein